MVTIPSNYHRLFKILGGGYAEYVAVPEDLLLPVPKGMSFTTAASIPEVWLTAYQLMHVAGMYCIYVP